MGVGPTIRRLRRDRDMTLEELALVVGTDSGNLSRLERDLQGYSPELLARIASALRVGVGELFGAAGVLDDVPHKGQVPLISWVQAGRWAEVMGPDDIGEVEQWLPCPVPHGSRTFVLRVNGPSMESPSGKPSFSEGDLIFVDPARVPVNRSIVVVRPDESKPATLRQLVIEGEERYLIALNPAWPDRVVRDAGDVTMIGVVIFKGERV